jgi:Domain of unknown function (DUF4112)
MPDDPAREIEVEILPPGATTGAGAASTGPIPAANSPRAVKLDPPKPEPNALDDPFISLVSRLMDSAFVIPGTKIRFGLDPLIGLWPGIGDGASALTSVVLLMKCARYGMPKIVLARMALNIVLNGTVGAFPIVGDAFSFWFKSNERNYALLRQHATKPGVSTRGDWLFVSALIGGTTIILALTVIGYVAMVATIIKLLFPH